MSIDQAGANALPLILLVEDELLIREMMAEALQAAGFATLVASDGQEAIKMFAEGREELRGLITDINFSDGLDGWQLARAVRERSSDLPVVYISGASGHEWAARGVPNSLLVAKPFAPAQVVVAISSLLVAIDTQT
jgi:DNA-binding response OmpR family regulator